MILVCRSNGNSHQSNVSFWWEYFFPLFGPSLLPFVCEDDGTRSPRASLASFFHVSFLPIQYSPKPRDRDIRYVGTGHLSSTHRNQANVCLDLTVTSFLSKVDLTVVALDF